LRLQFGVEFDDFVLGSPIGFSCSTEFFLLLKRLLEGGFQFPCFGLKCLLRFVE
jgi:hypothetical protein